jgi:hypothetical protein
LRYAAAGLAVFPCRPATKKPATAHGLLDATTDADTIRAWWRAEPRANVAIATGRVSGLIAVDVDPRNTGDESLAALVAQHGPLPETPESRTGDSGRHVFLAHPGGHVPCSQGKVAPGIDVKGDGGYVVLPPSIHPNGEEYAWGDSAPLGELPLAPCPEWLTTLIQTAAAETPVPAADGQAIPEGQRNATLARLGGVMRRVGMSQTEILAALLRVNIDRCHPPLEQREVEQIAASIARYAPDTVSVALVEDHFGQDHALVSQAQPLSTGELLRQCPLLRPPVIHGLLRRGETMNVIAPAKTGKSWLVLALAMAVATGQHWLDTFQTVPGPVLILDNELHPETLAHRIPQVAAALHVGLDEIRDRLFVQSLRGQLRDLFSLGPYFKSLTPGHFALIVLDAFYRFMPRDMDENDNGTMAGLYNQIDALADRLGCCFVLIHHTTKGNQSAKSVTDVGAGAGSQSRATDTHLVMRPHEESGAVVLDAAVRSWPPIEPMTLRWLFPIWTPAHDLDPALLRSEKPKRAKPSPKGSPDPPALSVERFVEVFIGTEPVTLPELREQAAKDPTLSWRRISDLLSIAEQRSLIQRVRLPGRGGPQGFVIAAEEVGS